MKVWVFVEGESDRLALTALWKSWSEMLRVGGWGICVIPLEDKSRFFRKIGPRVAQKLVDNSRDLVVGLPDLYPNLPYQGTEYQHAGLEELQGVQIKLVEKSLQEVFRVTDGAAYLSRFFPSALKHDLEMLLLCAVEALRGRLKTRDALGKWRHPPEEQNQQTPPKRIVESLFRTKLKKSYRDTTDAPAILRNIALRNVLFESQGVARCPVFQRVVDWIGTQTGVTGY